MKNKTLLTLGLASLMLALAAPAAFAGPGNRGNRANRAQPAATYHVAGQGAASYKAVTAGQLRTAKLQLANAKAQVRMTKLRLNAKLTQLNRLQWRPFRNHVQIRQLQRQVNRLEGTLAVAQRQRARIAQRVTSLQVALTTFGPRRGPGSRWNQPAVANRW